MIIRIIILLENMISLTRLVRLGMRIMDRTFLNQAVVSEKKLTNSSTSLAAHAAPLGMSYPPPAAQHQQPYQSSLPHSRSQDLYRTQQDYRPQPHPVQRQRTPAPDMYSYDDTPSLMPYDIPDRSHSQSQSQQSYTQSEQYMSRSPVYKTQANAGTGHGWGSQGQGQGQRRF
jgi:hypothetical protein